MCIYYKDKHFVKKGAFMILTNIESVPGKNIEEHFGVVSGSTVRAKNIGRDFMATLKNLVGGELKGYTELLQESRKEAMTRMTLQAEEMGANAVVNIRFATSSVTQGAAELLSLLGIAHKLDPELTIKLKSGVSYKLKPQLIFMHAGLNYAIPPETPTQAETILLKGGYFTFEWPQSASVLNKLGDLLSLIGVEYEQQEVQLPADGPMRLEAGGLTITNDKLTATLCPELKAEEPRVFITEAGLPPEVATLFFEEGLCPWIVQ